MMEDVRGAIRSFILENFLDGEPPENLTDEMDLMASGILNSIATLKLVSFIDERFKVQLGPDDLEPSNLATVRDIERLVNSKLGTKR